jgi:hypothetical protein
VDGMPWFGERSNNILGNSCWTWKLNIDEYQGYSDYKTTDQKKPAGAAGFFVRPKNQGASSMS